MNILIKPILIWLVAFAILLGASYNLYLSYNYKSNPDCNTYISIANSNFKNQNLVRKYRVIVPYAAKIVSLPIQKVYYHLWKNRSTNDDGPIRIGFLVVNLVLMSFVGLVLYYLGKEYNLDDWVCFFVVTAVLVGGRWGTLFSAIPITDSLYMLVISTVLLAIKKQNLGMLIPCLLVGTVSKEAFVMLIPYIFICFKHSKLKLFLWTIIGLFIAWILRYYIDLYSLNGEMMKSVSTDIDHIYNIKDSLKRIFGIRGIGEMFTLYGFFTFVFILGFVGGKQSIQTWIVKSDYTLWLLLPIAVVHALLSTEVSRMLYLFSAPLAIYMGLILQFHPISAKIKSVFI